MTKNNNLYLDEIRHNLKNHTEDLVLETMEELLNENEYSDICTCRQCLLDIASYALNRLPPKYIASAKGGLHTKIAEFHQQARVDIISAVTRAIKKVARNPHHDRK